MITSHELACQFFDKLFQFYIVPNHPTCASVQSYSLKHTLKYICEGGFHKLSLKPITTSKIQVR